MAEEEVEVAVVEEVEEEVVEEVAIIMEVIGHIEAMEVIMGAIMAVIHIMDGTVILIPYIAHHVTKKHIRLMESV